MVEAAVSRAERVRVYSVYGPGQVFSLSLEPSGAWAMLLSGNGSSVFAAPYLGHFAGVDPEAGAALYAALVAALGGPASTAPGRPDAAFTSVTLLEDEAPVAQRSFALYAPPAPWDAVQAQLVAQALGEWSQSPEAALHAFLDLDEAVFEAQGEPVIDLSLRALGRAPVALWRPELASNWRVVLRPQGLSGEGLARFPAEVDPNELSFEWLGPAPQGDWLTLAPGTGSQLRLRVLRRLPPGRWRVRVTWQAPAPGWGPRPAQPLSGAVTLNPDPLWVGARRG